MYPTRIPFLLIACLGLGLGAAGAAPAVAQAPVVEPAEPDEASAPREAVEPAEPVVADEPEEPDEPAGAVVDPPARVARLSVLEGGVSVAPAGSEDWSEAQLNRPLTSGDRIRLERDARAELQTGATTLHLDAQTSFGIIELDEDVLQVSLTEGAASVHVRRLSEHQTIQVETPNATVFLRRPGEYSFEVDGAGERTVVKSRGGEAEVAGRARSYRVRANEQGVFTGLDQLHGRIEPIAPRTAFESWANERERHAARSRSASYVAEDMVGYEDLDEHGEWIYEREYGHVWRPWVAVGDWAPYRYGHWAWIGPWGWTWVDDARWGFAPSHYGRWAYLRHRWCWVPGPRHLRPVYAPALVGWIGAPASGFAVSVGSGVGWFPLAPHEIYVPAYRHTPRYIRHVNLSNTLIVNNTYITNIYSGRGHPRHYRHRDAAYAVTAVSRDRFAGGRPVAGERMRIDEHELRSWRDRERPPAGRRGEHRTLVGEARHRRDPGRSYRNHDDANDNPKQRGDFRTEGQRVSAGLDKRRDPSREHGHAFSGGRTSGARPVELSEPAHSAAEPGERLRRDHMYRPPARGLQADHAGRANRERQPDGTSDAPRFVTSPAPRRSGGAAPRAEAARPEQQRHDLIDRGAPRTIQPMRARETTQPSPPRRAEQQSGSGRSEPAARQHSERASHPRAAEQHRDARPAGPRSHLRTQRE